MVAGDELGFRLGDIERVAVRLREPADEEQDESDNVQRKGAEEEPVLEVSDTTLLRRYDVLEVQASHLDDDGKDDDGRRDLVAHHLRRRAHAAIERVFVVRGPAGHQNADRAERSDRDDVQNTDIQVGDNEPVRPRQHGKGRERAHDDEKRCELEEKAIRSIRDDVFFEEKLHPIGKALQDAVPADPHRTETILDVGRDLTLPPNEKDG